MIIDFHTHIFPDKIAAKAIPNLASVIHLEPSMNGTIDGLKASMERSHVEISVVHPIVTKPQQFESILQFAVHVNETCAEGPGPRLISFASIHPLSEDYKAQLHLIKREGFSGIKLHPNYQGLHFDDIRYMRIIDKASELGLSVLTHAGYDPYTPEEEFCTPDMALRVLGEVKPPKLILAHMGSNENYDEVEEKLCGRQVYLDTAYSIMHMSQEQFERMVHLHGARRILFGTDAPWTYQKSCVERLQSYTGISQEEKKLIFCQNAKLLLNLSSQNSSI